MSMTIYEEWRIFDPADGRTQPEGTAEIFAEFDNGKTFRGLFSRDAGMFAHGGTGNMPLVGDAKIVRWRYATPLKYE